MTELSKKFERQYAYGYLSQLYIKTTVSEIKKKSMQRSSVSKDAQVVGVSETGSGKTLGEEAYTKMLFEEEEVVPYIPSFVKEKEGLSGTDRGSAYHKVMELLEFSTLLTTGGKNRAAMCTEIDHRLSQFVRQEILSPEWRDGVRSDKIAAFFETELASRMASAEKRGRLYKEQPFVLSLPANRISEDFPDTEQILIQGIIDVYFEEEGKIVLADYKTDAVKEPEELTERYKIQLDYYAEALERITGKEVSQKIIYSFALGREIVVY